MTTTSRVTVTLPTELVRDIDQLESNRSRFMLEAARRELERRRQEALRASLREPHAETNELADAGLAAWANALPDEDPYRLVGQDEGTAVRWVEGEGWTQGEP